MERLGVKVDSGKYGRFLEDYTLHDENYSGLFGPYNRHLRQKTLEYAGKYFKKNCLVLDVGCGDGFSIKAIKRALNASDKNYLGMDVSPIRLARAREAAENLICGSAEQLPFRNSSVDLVLFNEVVEHLNKPENALFEIYRVLRKGGLLLMDFPNEYNSRIVKLLTLHFPLRHPGHLSIITPKRIRTWAKGRFEVVFKRTFPVDNMPFFMCGNYFMVLKKI